MNRFLRNWVLSVLTVFLIIAITGTGLAEKKEITILQTSDIHGYIYPWSYKMGESADIGLARISTAIKQTKEENPDLLLVDSGDTIQGSALTSLYRDREDVSHPVIKVMNKMGYKAMVLGNHEFNFGLSTLERIVSEAHFSVIGANITYRNDGTLYITPYVIEDVAGVEVGILGLTTPNIPRWDGEKVASLSFTGMTETAGRFIPEMREKGADIIVCLAHAGLEGRHHPTGGDMIRKLAANHPEIEVILAGHDHQKVNTVINGVLIAAPEDKGRQVTRVDIKLSGKQDKWNVTDKKAELIETDGIAPDEQIMELAAPYHQETLDYVNTSLGWATGDFVPDNRIRGIPETQIRDTALVDLINQVQLKYTGADISAAALFNWSPDLEQGPVTIKDIDRIYKYSNKLYKVSINGAQLKRYMERSAAYYNTYQPGDVTISFNPEMMSYSYDMFAGVDYKIDISEPPGNRIKELEFKGKPVKYEQKFTLAVNDFRYSGLKSAGIITDEPSFRSQKEIKQLINDYIKEKQIIKPRVDNNWEIIGIDLDHWARGEAIELYNRGIIQIPDKNRAWNGASLNLEDWAPRRVLIRSLVEVFDFKLPSRMDSPSTYRDVSGEVGRYAEAARQAGIKPGRTDDMFGPEDVISREKAAAMMVRALKIEPYGEPAVLSKFKDGNQVSAEYENEVATLVEMGILSGRTNQMLAPRLRMKMGGLVSMLYNYLANYSRMGVR